MNATTLVLVVMALIVVGILVRAATKPDVFRLQRSIVIDAMPERIFPLIDDLRAHESWNPFDKPDPDTRKTHTGAIQGAGAVYEWNGKGQAGAGRLSILESAPSSRIGMQLEMLKPFKTSNQVTFTLVPEGAATHLTWSMQGPVPYPAKIMHTLFNMDRMVGKQFEAGLMNLKNIAETYR
ncbi:polyketide cyclase [Pseudoxanthomonas yeongjuensis]|uniref:SRPBCC family protein n=1 Tax=Pseudoxanthomonas yeongjuensis TaxID=377616 RepID=UPI0013907C15|nr:SRPBCC family protein [Pseudoxanthomonas yeongjuensis]KAF1717899.1 polyketide cyclase [Pseudoxanthomonas yeongjuensis]